MDVRFGVEGCPTFRQPQMHFDVPNGEGLSVLDGIIHKFSAGLKLRTINLYIVSLAMKPAMHTDFLFHCLVA